MKKLLASVGAVVIAGVLGVSYYNANSGDRTEEPKTEEAAEQETPNAPTERTVDMAGKPWEYFGVDVIESYQSNGETVYLFEDAEAIENLIKDFIAAEPVEGAPITKEEDAQSMAKYLNAFITGMEKYYPEKETYFAKLKEVVADLNNADYEGVATKINEAQSLRAE